MAIFYYGIDYAYFYSAYGTIIDRNCSKVSENLSDAYSTICYVRACKVTLSIIIYDACCIVTSVLLVYGQYYRVGEKAHKLAHIIIS